MKEIAQGSVIVYMRVICVINYPEANLEGSVMCVYHASGVNTAKVSQEGSTQSVANCHKWQHDYNTAHRYIKHFVILDGSITCNVI
jgi:hypothetical protein